MVAGAEPDQETSFAERVRIIAVNAPSSAIFGASGTYLDSYMLHAIQHIADVADGIWEKMNPDATNTTEKGFPIVINLSFGKHAGSGDIYDRFAAALDQFQCHRMSEGKTPVRFVMPVGNDNLERCNAYLEPGKDQKRVLNWRMQPQDQSSNYSEVWFSQDVQRTKRPRPAIRLSLSAPGSSAKTFRPPKLKKGETKFCVLKRRDVVVAHLYVTRVRHRGQLRDPLEELCTDEQQVSESANFRYILCVAPTYRLDGNPSVAESGLWEISVTNNVDDPIQTTLSVQTDQGLTPSRTINRRSYFDDDGYQTHDRDRDGRVLESYSYPKDENGKYHNRDIEATTPVRRHGTINASAAHGAVARVGGYRASDGRPAFYSSTGRGRSDGSDTGTRIPFPPGHKFKRAPTAALPTDDGPAHGGILSAGSADGSRVVMRGTSFAASQASRCVIAAVINALKDPKESNDKTASQIIWQTAKDAEDQRNAPDILTYDVELIESIGGGRISPQGQAAVRRVFEGPFRK